MLMKVDEFTDPSIDCEPNCLFVPKHLKDKRLSQLGDPETAENAAFDPPNAKYMLLLDATESPDRSTHKANLD